MDISDLFRYDENRYSPSEELDSITDKTLSVPNPTSSLRQRMHSDSDMLYLLRQEIQEQSCTSQLSESQRTHISRDLQDEYLSSLPCVKARTPTLVHDFHLYFPVAGTTNKPVISVYLDGLQVQPFMFLMPGILVLKILVTEVRYEDIH